MAVAYSMALLYTLNKKTKLENEFVVVVRRLSRRALAAVLQKTQVWFLALTCWLITICNGQEI